jgi:L-iditol 2-dehydrogenase
MKAAVWRGPHDLRIEEMPKPVPSEGEVLIRTEVVGVCGTDLEVYDGGFEQSKPPLIMGHEGGGIIESVGPRVSNVRKGDRVAVDGLLSCGACGYCEEGHYGLCDNLRTIGIAGAQGEYADYFVAPEKNCYLLPEKISWAEAAMIDTLAGPIHGFNKIEVTQGDTVAVFGPGPAGLFYCRLAKLRGASRVYLVGTRDNRLAMGTTYGADVLLNVERENAVEAIKAGTDGRGVDIVIEAAGSARALNDGLKALKKAGTLQIYGVFGGGPISVDVMPIQIFEYTVLGSCGLDYPSAIELIAQGTVVVKDLVSHTFNLEEVVQAFSSRFIQERRDNYIKGVVRFP